jgi:hypothetical protein
LPKHGSGAQAPGVPLEKNLGVERSKRVFYIIYIFIYYNAFILKKCKMPN